MAHGKIRIEGVSKAFDESSLVLDAIRSGRHRRIAICFVDWSGAQKLVIDWTDIGDAESAHAFADRLLQCGIVDRHRRFASID